MATQAPQMQTLTFGGGSSQQLPNVYEFIIFSKTGSCLFHVDFTGTINFEKEKDKQSEVYQRQKLLFGLIWSLIFSIIYYRYKITAFFLVAVIFIAISLFAPKIFEKIKFYQYWIKFGNFIGKINSLIIIGILYFFIFTPIGIVMSILRKDLCRP